MAHQQAFPVWTPDWPMWRETASRIVLGVVVVDWKPKSAGGKLRSHTNTVTLKKFSPSSQDTPAHPTSPTPASRPHRTNCVQRIARCKQVAHKRRHLPLPPGQATVRALRTCYAFCALCAR